MGEFLFENCEVLVKEVFWDKYPPERGKPYCRREPINGKTLQVQVWETLEDLRKTHDGERKRRILILYFQLDGGPRRTLEEIGREFSRTRETIRRVRNSALRQLRHPSRSSRLKLYLDNPIHEAAAANLKRIEEARKERKAKQEAKRALREKFLQPKNLSFEERQGEIRALRQIYEKTQISFTAPYPNRFINKLLRRRFLFSDLKTFTMEELVILLDMPGSKTEQCLKEMWQLANQKRASGEIH